MDSGLDRRPSAARVRGRSSASFQTSVRSRSQAIARTSAREAVREDQPEVAWTDVRGDVRDLLRRELAAERRHHALPARHALDDERGRRLLLVEVRADRPGRARVLERVAALAAGGLEDLLARDRVALRLRRRRNRADDRLRRGGHRLAAAAREHEAARGEDQDSRRTGASLLNGRTTATQRPSTPRARGAGRGRSRGGRRPAASTVRRVMPSWVRAAQPADGRQ